MERATPTPLDVIRYEHGGGRLYKEEPRKLVADFFYEEDRELFIYMRNSLPALIAVAEAAAFLREAHGEVDGSFYTKQVYEGAQLKLDKAIADL